MDIEKPTRQELVRRYQDLKNQLVALENDLPLPHHTELKKTLKRELKQLKHEINLYQLSLWDNNNAT